METENITLENAIEAFEADDFDRSFRLFETLVRRDKDPEAMYFLGRHYIDGLGVEASEEKAMDIWKRSSKRGNLYAQYAILEIVQTTTACCKG